MIQQRASDLMRAGIAQRHQHVQIVDGLDMELRHHRRQIGLQQRQPPQLFFQHVAPRLHVAHAVELVEPRPHLVARASAGQKPVGGHQPVATRLAAFRGENLDALAAAQCVVQRDDAAVHLRAAAAMADHRVHVIREIERRCAHRQIDHIALRRQRIDAVFDEFAVQRVAEPLFGAALVLARIASTVQQSAHPFDLAIQAGIGRRRTTFLVPPVRGHTQLGLRVHLMGADLHFQGLALGTDHRGVQRPVVVTLRPRDVIVELAGDRRPQGVHRAQRGVAGRHILHQHPHRAQIV